MDEINLTVSSKVKYDILVLFEKYDGMLSHSNKYAIASKYQCNNGVGDLYSISGDQQHFLVLRCGSVDVSLHEYLQALEKLCKYLNSNTMISSLDIILEDSLANIFKLSIDDFLLFTLCNLLNNLYIFDDLKSKKTIRHIRNINIVSNVSTNDVVKQAYCWWRGMNLLKHLANNPANIITPQYIVDYTQQSIANLKDVTIDVLDYQKLKELNMNAFLSVSHGSSLPPKFIILEYGAKYGKPILLIGKGITFDTGGISLKPSADMDRMKFDMCGAATVIAAFVTAAAMQLPIHLVCLVPVCENMPSGTATRPGDVVTTMSGLTVEILNTDAEGRLILCDALTYAKQFDPICVIDIATLTGACVIALGDVASGLYSNDDSLADELEKSAIRTDDLVWRMPLLSQYDDMLKSVTADLRNIGSWKGAAGSVTAACFLKQFVQYKWAHLDIAGTSTVSAAHGQVLASGRPFFMLIDFLRNKLYAKE
jgi:leucyl aminopeptidase